MSILLAAETAVQEVPSVWADPIVWLLLAATLGLAVTVILLRRKRPPAETAAAVIPPTDMAGPAQPAGSVAVSKLHEVGKRDRQEDSLSISPIEMLRTHGLLAVVADGMGGLSNGDQVSSAVVTAVMGAFVQGGGEEGELVLCGLLQKAVAEVRAALEPSQYGKCGSTLVMGLLRDGRFHFLSVGDSIICLYREGKLLRLNRAHIYRNELILRAVNGNAELKACTESRRAAGLTSFLGMEELPQVDLPAEPVEALPGDRFILMSDGVYNALSAQELCEALRNEPDAIAGALRQKIEQKDYAGQDNYTAIVLSL